MSHYLNNYHHVSNLWLELTYIPSLTDTCDFKEMDMLEQVTVNMSISKAYSVPISL